MSSAFILSVELADALDNIETASQKKFAPKPDAKPDAKKDVDVVLKPRNNSYHEETLEDKDQDENQEKHDWVYLDKDAQDSTINYEFGLCRETNNKMYKVYVCAYRVNADCRSPFLQYLMERGTGAEYDFPYFHFGCPDSLGTNSFSFSGIIDSLFGKQPSEEPIHDLSQGHTYFLNQCFMRILELIEHDEDHDLALDGMYKGFVEHGTNSIYAFFDFTGKTLAETKNPRSWTIIDEIINTRSTLGYKINSDVYNVFIKNPKLVYIDDKDGYHIETPSTLYLCKDEGGQYANIFQDDPQTFSLYNERIEHPYFGDFYIFSLSPLESSTGVISQLKRFVGFTPDPTYILKDLATITGKGPIAGEPEFMGFKLPKAMFGGPKKEDQAVSEDQEPEDQEPEDQEPEDQEPEDQAESERQQELEQLKSIDTTSIYFKENGIPYWCIKSRLYFAEY